MKLNTNNSLNEIFHAQQNLGLLKTAQRLTGGRIHQVYCVETTQGKYVVKILNPDKIATLGRHQYEQFELIASSFKNKGVNAVPALNEKTQYIFAENKYYFIYPFQAGSVINGSQMNTARAFRIGTLLGKMHKADLTEIEIPTKLHQYAVDIEKWTELNKNPILVSKFKEIDQNCRKACQQHQPLKTVISHGDMDLANIIWDEKDQPWLIDWEYAGKFDALYDLINSALYVSEILPGDFNIDLFKATIEGYSKHLTVLDQYSSAAVSESFYLAMAGWMRWINYNYIRLESSSSHEEKTLAISQIDKWTKTVLAVHNRHLHFAKIIIDKQKQELNVKKTNSFWQEPKTIMNDNLFQQPIVEKNNYLNFRL